MIISDFLNKIKGHVDIDKITIMYFLIIIFVGISAFGLGRLSIENNDILEEDTGITITNNNIIDNNLSHNTSSLEINRSINKLYVASKNGKLYYKASCSGAKRILPKNEVWFSTASEAEKLGYTLSSSCK